jgi:hypothetical protein
VPRRVVALLNRSLLDRRPLKLGKNERPLAKELSRKGRAGSDPFSFFAEPGALSTVARNLEVENLV